MGVCSWVPSWGWSAEKKLQAAAAAPWQDEAAALEPSQTSQRAAGEVMGQLCGGGPTVSGPSVTDNSCAGPEGCVLTACEPESEPDVSPTETTALPHVIVPTPIPSSIVIVPVKAPLHTTSWLPSGRPSPAHLEANSFLRPSADRSQARCTPNHTPPQTPATAHTPPTQPAHPCPPFPFRLPEMVHPRPLNPQIQPLLTNSILSPCHTTPIATFHHSDHPSPAHSVQLAPGLIFPTTATLYPRNGNNNDVSPVLPRRKTTPPPAARTAAGVFTRGTTREAQSESESGPNHLSSLPPSGNADGTVHFTAQDHDEGVYKHGLPSRGLAPSHQVPRSTAVNQRSLQAARNHIARLSKPAPSAGTQWSAVASKPGKGCKPSEAGRMATESHAVTSTVPVNRPHKGSSSTADSTSSSPKSRPASGSGMLPLASRQPALAAATAPATARVNSNARARRVQAVARPTEPASMASLHPSARQSNNVFTKKALVHTFSRQSRNSGAAAAAAATVAPYPMPSAASDLASSADALHPILPTPSSPLQPAFSLNTLFRGARELGPEAMPVTAGDHTAVERAAAAASAAAAAWATPSGVFDPVFTSDSNRPISTPLPPTHASPCNKLAAGLSARELGRRALPLTPDEQTEVETTSAALHCADRPAELPSESTADVGTAYTPAMSTPAPAFAFSSFFAGARLPPVRALMTAEEVTAAEEAAAAVLVSSAYCAVKGMLADQVLTAGGGELCAAHTLEAQDSMTQPLSEADMLAFWAGEEVGKGAGGCVYSIEWEEAPAGRAALKMCIVGPDPETIAAALREACLLAHLHAAAGGGGGAVRVFRVGISRGEEQGTLLVWTVMTQCQGELSHLFQAQRDKTYRMNAQFTADNAARFPPALVRSHTTAMQLRNALPLVRSMRDAAAAVSLCQQIGVVHGDIKFNNAMFSSGRNSPLVLIDFGTAKLLHGAPTAPMEGMATLPFMAPECFRNRSANCSCPIVSFATDVFAIGTMSAALAGDIARVLAVRFPDAPAFLLRMIHTDPDQRPHRSRGGPRVQQLGECAGGRRPQNQARQDPEGRHHQHVATGPTAPSRAVMRQLADISAYLELRLCLSDDMSHDMQWLGKFDMRAAWLTSDAVGCVGQLGSYMIGIALMVWVGEPDELLAGMEEGWQAMGQNMERVRTVLAAEGITCSLMQASVEHAARFESVYAS
ncbi:MAG: hypothetical protein WDW38_011116 [Sanguina aurantia]